MTNEYYEQNDMYQTEDEEQSSYFDQGPSNCNDGYTSNDHIQNHIYEDGMEVGEEDSLHENQSDEGAVEEYYYEEEAVNHDEDQAMAYENGSAYSVQNESSATTLNAFEALAQKERDLERDYAEAEQEYNNECAMLSSITAFEKEELDLLNENFSILTQKIAKRKKCEKIFDEKIIKTRDSLIADIENKIEPLLKRLKPQLKRIKSKYVENRKKNHLKFIEAKNELDCLSQNNITQINEEMKQIENKIQEVNIILQETKFLEQEYGNIQGRINELEKQTELEQTQLLFLEKEINSIDLNLNLLENEKKTQSEEFSIEEANLKRDCDKLDEIIESKDIELNKVNENIMRKNAENKEVTKTLEQVKKDNEQLLNSLQTLNLQTHEHLEKLTLQNNIEKDSDKYETLNSENTKLLEELNRSEQYINNLNQDIDGLQKEQNELNDILSQLDLTVETLNEEYNNLDTQIKTSCDTIVETKESELNKIKEIKMMEFDQEVKIIEKQLEDIENDEKKIAQRLEETKLESVHEQNSIEIMIEQVMIQIENLNIDLDNCKSLVLHTQQEIEHNENDYNSKLKNIDEKKKTLILKESNDSAEYTKNLNILKENIQVLDQNIEDTVSNINENQSILSTLQDKVRESIEKDAIQKQNIHELCGVIGKQENELNSIDRIKREDLNQMEKELNKMKIQVEEETKNIENERENLKKNKITIHELKRQLKVMETDRATLLNQINETTENISREKTAHENKKSELVQSFTKKEKQNQHLFEHMKKSYANKLVFHKQDIEKLKHTIDDINNTRDKIKADIDQCAKKEAELATKIEKKTVQLENLKQSADRIKNILEQSGSTSLTKLL